MSGGGHDVALLVEPFQLAHDVDCVATLRLREEDVDVGERQRAGDDVDRQEAHRTNCLKDCMDSIARTTHLRLDHSDPKANTLNAPSILLQHIV